MYFERQAHHFPATANGCGANDTDHDDAAAAGPSSSEASWDIDAIINSSTTQVTDSPSSGCCVRFAGKSNQETKIKRFYWCSYQEEYKTETDDCGQSPCTNGIFRIYSKSKKTQPGW